MQILRTRGIKSHGWGGYLNCMIHPTCLPVLVFRYMPRTNTKYLKYIVNHVLAVSAVSNGYSYSDMPIGMSADTCIQYWNDL